MDERDLALLTKLLDKDVELGEKLRDQGTELEKKTRAIVGLLNKIHSTPSQSIPALVDTARPMLADCQASTAAIAALIPPHQFWRFIILFHSISLSIIQSAVFTAALVEYLSTGDLLSLPRASEILGIKEEWKDRLYLQAEDYLLGLISLVNELSRYCVNVVTMGNHEEPIRISNFVKDMFAGFSMLNLKNDLLRRRFDSLKYDIKKIEEVVYDLSLRRLAPQTRELSPSAQD
ncbi:Translin [Gautieria morchelliformis]|nr:Translin [Gautieria morchelliformis]